MSDPLSLSASIAGLITLSTAVYTALSDFADRVERAPKTTQEILHAVVEMRLALTSISGLIESFQRIPPRRKAMVQLDHLVICVTQTVMTFRDLEVFLSSWPEISSMQSNAWKRIRWALREDKAIQLVKRLQDNKTSLLLILNILHSESDFEAQISNQTLREQMEKLMTENREMRTLMNQIGDDIQTIAGSVKFYDDDSSIRSPTSPITPQSPHTALRPAINHPFDITKSTELELVSQDPSSSSPKSGGTQSSATPKTEPSTSVSLFSSTSTSPQRRSFSIILDTTWVYGRVRRNATDLSMTSSRLESRAWSMFSGLSLNDISVISFIRLPLKLSDIPNSRWYAIDDENYQLKVLNLPLAEQTRLTRISKRLEDSRDKTEFWMPAFPWRAIDYLNYKGCEVEGLYRVPGSGPQIKKYQRKFDEHYDVNLFEDHDLYDMNVIGSMLKAWLRELPDELFPKAAQDRISRECAGADEVPELLIEELSNLSPFNYYLLFVITCHLSLLLAHSDKNKMDFRNLCICFQPCMKIDAFCFKFLVCNWRDCWRGCKNEGKYIEEEYMLFDDPPPQDIAAPRNIAEPQKPRTRDSDNERHQLSSSDSSKAAGFSPPEQKPRLKEKHLRSLASNGSVISNNSLVSGNGLDAGRPEKVIIAILGEPISGKSSLFDRICGGFYNPAQQATIEARRVIKPTLKGRQYQVEIVDTAGIFSYEHLVDAAIWEAHGFIITCPVQGADLTAIEKFHARILNKNETPGQEKRPPVVIAITKYDLASSEKDYSMEDARALAEEKECELHITSAKDGIGIQDAFLSVLGALVGDDSLEEKRKRRPLSLMGWT